MQKSNCIQICLVSKACTLTIKSFVLLTSTVWHVCKLFSIQAPLGRVTLSSCPAFSWVGLFQVVPTLLSARCLHSSIKGQGRELCGKPEMAFKFSVSLSWVKSSFTCCKCTWDPYVTFLLKEVVLQIFVLLRVGPMMSMLPLDHQGRQHLNLEICIIFFSLCETFDYYSKHVPGQASQYSGWG
jgi:hypothetical protein